MSFAAHVYSPLVWYNIDGPQVIYKVVNRADNPEPGGDPIDFPSLQVITYAGHGKWASEDDWWTVAEMRLFNHRYQTAKARAAANARTPLSRLDWSAAPDRAPAPDRGAGADSGTGAGPDSGTGTDWARPPAGHQPSPSWLGRDVPPITRLSDIDVGVRHPVAASRRR